MSSLSAECKSNTLPQDLLAAWNISQLRSVQPPGEQEDKPPPEMLSNQTFHQLVSDTHKRCQGDFSGFLNAVRP